MREDGRIVGIIKKVSFGYDMDHDDVGLNLAFSLENGYGTDLFVPFEKCREFIKKMETKKERDLIGKPCWVKQEGKLYSDPLPAKELLI